MGKERGSAEETIKTIRRKTRRQYSAEEKTRIVMEGLRGEESVVELCRREGLARREPGICGGLSFGSPISFTRLPRLSVRPMLPIQQSQAIADA